MIDFTVHTKESAPLKSVAMLDNTEKTIGFIPNLYGVFAESPTALKAYQAISKIFDESSFSPTERQLILLTVSSINLCHYCMAAHSAVAALQKVPAEVIDLIRMDHPQSDIKLEALRIFVTAIVENRGWASADEIDAFVDAGYNKAQILEVIVGVSFKTMSNYSNHIARTPLDDAFATLAWQPVPQRLAG